jgi:hypothetical protein
VSDGWKEWSAHPRAPKHDPLIEASCVAFFGAQTGDQIIRALAISMAAACAAHTRGWRME